MRNDTKPGSRPKQSQARGNPQERNHDPYRAQSKLKGPARCTGCGATYVNGHWRWQGVMPPARATTVCPACRRVADRYPAGEITVGGSFVAAHAGEIENLIRNTADKESGEHPLHRLMELKRRKGRYGLASACIGGGQGIAIIIKNEA